MDFDGLRNYCLSLPSVTEEIQWGHDLLFKVGGKMFCVAGTEPPYSLSIKVTDEDFAELIERDGIIPAPYLARNKWVHLETPSTLPTKELKSYIDQSYRIISSKLSKRLQKELGLIPA
jgi:predicted DNA-binding protein (MmcQ/YjbR family)